MGGLVDRVWCAWPEPAAEVRVEWILPTCQPQLILSPRSSIFVGPKVVAERIERRTDEPTVGVSLTAGAASAFTGSGGQETCGLTVPLDSMMSIGSLADRLAVRDSEAVFDILESELVGWLGHTPVHPRAIFAAQAIRRGHPAHTIFELLDVDRRTFVSEFRRLVGVAPKHYERICRFNRVIQAIRQPAAVPLARLAADHGFADQAHLTREIRSFASTSPSRIHRRATEMINHLEPDKMFKT